MHRKGGSAGWESHCVVVIGRIVVNLIHPVGGCTRVVGGHGRRRLVISTDKRDGKVGWGMVSKEGGKVKVRRSGRKDRW